jgi:hypothetical protein
VVELVRKLYTKGIGLLYTPALAKTLGCGITSIVHTLKKLVDTYHRLEASTEQFLSLSAYNSKESYRSQEIYTLASVDGVPLLRGDVDSFVKRINLVRDAINKLAEDVANGGGIDWAKFVKMEMLVHERTLTSQEWRNVKVAFRSAFAKALFDMVMSSPDDPMWSRPDSPFK